MLKIVGKYTEAKVFASIVENEAINQIAELCNQSWAAGSKIAIMADTHAGKGCTIGTAMQITDKVCPNLVGVDIGCGMLVIELGKIDIDFDKLDKVIRRNIPSGRNVRNKSLVYFNLSDIKAPLKDVEYLEKSLGTLGGGNHFIEIDVDSDGNKYLVVHTGSRHLGIEVADYWMKVAKIQNKENGSAELIARLKAEGREKEISAELAKLKAETVVDDLAYVSGDNFDGYINDMGICQKYADYNRILIADVICEKMGWNVIDYWSTIHNYIDMDSMVLRKGAVSAYDGQRCLIPMNMRDGSLICVGKGNSDFLCTAPHGAGRLMSRSKARNELSLDEFKETMSDIYSTTVCQETLDEAPMAYKPMDAIMEDIKDTVNIVNIIKPVYNYKASE